MGSYQMAILLHLTDQLLIARNIYPQKEKRGLHIPLSQAVQQLLRADRVGAVVKGEGDQLLSRRNRGARLPLSGLQHCIGLRRRPRRGREHPPGQRKKQQQRGDKCPRPPPPGSSLHPARRLSKILWP